MEASKPTPAKRAQPEAPAANTGTATRRRSLLQLSLGLCAAPALPGYIGRARAASVIRIAQTEALTGPSSAYGLRCRDGAQMAIEEINAAGGIRDAKGNVHTLEMATADMANDARQAITLYRQHALDQSVMVALGPANSVGYVPMVPLTGQLKLPLIGSAGAPVRRWTEWAFRINPVSLTATPALLEKVVPALGIKRLAVIFDQTQDAQAGDAEACRLAKAKLGYEIVADQAFSGGDQDFAPQITTIKNARPDAIYVASTTTDGIKVTSQIRAMGIDLPLLTGYGNFQDPLYWDGTNGGIRDCYTWTAQDYKSATGALADWLGRYNAKNRLEATAYSAYGYDSVFVAAEAIRRADSADRAGIQRALASLDYRTPIGTHVTFKNPPSGENMTPTVIVVKVTGRAAYTAV